jgi:hypothetical protein
VKQENSEHCPLLRRAEGQLATLVEHFERTEDPELHTESFTS